MQQVLSSLAVALSVSLVSAGTYQGGRSSGRSDSAITFSDSRRLSSTPSGGGGSAQFGEPHLPSRTVPWRIPTVVVMSTRYETRSENWENQPPARENRLAALFLGSGLCLSVVRCYVTLRYDSNSCSVIQ